jgi:hypothetical protein
MEMAMMLATYYPEVYPLDKIGEAFKEAYGVAFPKSYLITLRDELREELKEVGAKVAMLRAQYEAVGSVAGMAEVFEDFM